MKEKIESLKLAECKRIDELEQLKADIKKMQEALMKCASNGTNPAIAALRVLYNLPSDRSIVEVNRQTAKGKVHAVWDWEFPDVTVTFRMNETNHNVAATFMSSTEISGLTSGILAINILHPFDPSRVQKLRVQKTELNGSFGSAIDNFMTSTEFDDFTFNGKYYVCSGNLP
jgi:hypothetical protein